MKKIICWPAAFFILLSFDVYAAEKCFDPAFEPIVTRLINDGQDSTFILQLFQDEQVKFIEKLVPLNMIPGENQEAYDGFLDRDQVEDGYYFMDTNRNELQNILQGSNIPIEVVIAILKVESNFGRRSGDVSVFAAFATIGSMNDPCYWKHLINTSDALEMKPLKKRAKKRSEWAYQELKSFIKLCEMQGWDPLKVKGSWAGAFGLAQFLPSSYLHYGRDGDGDHKINPDELQDAVASLVYYLKKARWGDSYKSQRKALLRYNPSSAYADCILEYAQKLKMRMESETTSTP